MSAPFDATQVIAWTGARWIQGGEDVHFGGASIDTRSLEAGSLFVAIRGVRHDAHEFLGTALAAGATGIYISSFIKEHLHDVRVARTRSGNQRCLPQPQRFVRVGSGCQKPLSHLSTSIPSRSPDRCCPKIIREVDVRPGPDQYCDALKVVAVASPEQGGRTVACLHVDVSALIQE